MTIFLVYTSPFSVAQFLRDIIDIITKAAVEKPLKSQHLIAYEDCGIEEANSRGGFGCLLSHVAWTRKIVNESLIWYLK